MSKKIQFEIAALTLPLSKGSEPVQLMPSGTFEARAGALRGKGPWHLNPANAKALIALAALRVNDILVDYEHQSLLSAENGKPAPAAGWIKPNTLAYDETKGLFAVSVQWTEAALSSIAADEYRYISPVFTYDPKSGDVLNLISIALTNSPAIDGMASVSLAAATQHFLSQHHEEIHVAATTEAVNQALGLKQDASEAEALQAIAALSAKAQASDDKDTQIAALKAAAPDTAKFVPVAVVTELQTQLAALSAKQESSEIDKLIETNIAKLPTPGLQAWAKKQSVAALTAYLAGAPEVAALTAMQTGGKSPVVEAQTGLTHEELAVCKQLGLTADEYKKNRGEQ